MVLFTLGGCMGRVDASHFPRTVSYAIPPETPSTLHSLFAGEVRRYPGTSGLRLIDHGEDAFLTRLAMVRLAEHSLDLQYYSIHDDGMGQIVMKEILRAADRGVRVRFLVDDLNMKAIDATARMFDAHPHIEMRSYNPLTTAKHPFWSRVTHYFTDTERYTRRMHNKVVIADNRVAVIGGRNIGDSYFNASDDYNFSDLDVLTVGPVTEAASRSFDRYWNSDQAFPLEAAGYAPASEAHIQRTRRALEANWHQIRKQYPKLPIDHMDAAAQLRNGTSLIWAPASLSVDLPEKTVPEADGAIPNSPPMHMLGQMLVESEKEFVAVAPYLIPQKEGVEFLTGLARQGVAVRILTNSLASTDVVAVHTAYSRYRLPLVKGGVELYELKPIPGKRARRGSLLGSSSRSSLHAKVYVIDRRHVVIGSFNMDPRSLNLNTEMAVMAESPVIAEQLLNMFRQSTDAASSYRLVLAEGDAPEGEALRWVTQEKDGEKIYDADPKPGLRRRIMAWLISLLPIEEQL